MASSGFGLVLVFRQVSNARAHRFLGSGSKCASLRDFFVGRAFISRFSFFFQGLFGCGREDNLHAATVLSCTSVACRVVCVVGTSRARHTPRVFREACSFCRVDLQEQTNSKRKLREEPRFLTILQQRLDSNGVVLRERAADHACNPKDRCWCLFGCSIRPL